MSDVTRQGPGVLAQIAATTVGRIVAAFFVPAATFVVLYYGFIFLRDSGAPQGVIAAVAIVWGVGGVACSNVRPSRPQAKEDDPRQFSRTRRERLIPCAASAFKTRCVTGADDDSTRTLPRLGNDGTEAGVHFE